jgi:hypothetical protein
MRYDLIDSLLIGGSIGLIVLAIRALTDGASSQLKLLALLAAGGALFCVQLALLIRRRRRAGRPAEDQAEAERRPARMRRDRRNPFFRELTQDWTGLDEHIAERNTTDLELPEDQPDDLWIERSTTKDQRPKPREERRK